MDALEYLAAVLREKWEHIARGVDGARRAYAASVHAHEDARVPFKMRLDDNDESYHPEQDHQPLIIHGVDDSLYTSPAYSGIPGNLYHHEIHH